MGKARGHIDRDMKDEKFYEQLFADGVRRTNGAVEARRYNLLAAKLIAELVSDLLGPRGLEKMFVDILEESTVTKDGATFLRKIDVEHPAAKVLIDAANAVDNAVGDGTTSVVVLAGALVQKAEELLNMGISPATISEGYKKGMEAAIDILKLISKQLPNSDRSIMQKLAATCLRTKAISYAMSDEDHAAQLIVNALLQIADFSNRRVDADDIKIEEKPGSPSDTQLVMGIVIDKTIDSSSMPREISNARILLVDEDLEPKTTRTDAQISITSPTHYKLFTDRQSEEIMKNAKKIVDAGVNVVISRAGISLSARTYFARNGIISVRRVKENDLIWLEKATGGKITREFDNISEVNIGHAERVYEKFVGDDKMVFVEGCKNPRSVTLLLRAGSKRLLDEYHRSALDAINVLKDFIENPSIIAGGGATDAIIAREIRRKAARITGREQIVLQKFADALEQIPLTIAKNAGMDTIDTLIELRSKNIPAHYSLTSVAAARINGISNNNRCHHHERQHQYEIVNGKWFGIDAMSRKVDEMFGLGIVEPSVVKEQIIKTAVEVTNLLLRVDDVLISKPTMETHSHSHGHSHSHADGTIHSHEGGEKAHDHYFDMLGKQQRPMHHHY